MVLDTLNERKINIKDITLEEPEESIYEDFQPERDIKRLWPNIMNVFEDFSSIKSGSSILKNAAIIHVLAPEKIAELNMGEMSIYMFQDIEAHASQPSDQILEDYMYLRIFLPASAAHMENNPKIKKVFDNLQQVIQARTANLRDFPNAYGIFDTEFKIKLGFPQLLEDVIFPDESIDEYIKLTKEIGSEAIKSREYMKFQEFISFLTAAKVLFPKQFSESNLMSKENWQYFNKWLAGLGNLAYTVPFHVESFLEAAFYMKILAADEVRISKERGFELIMSTKEPSFSETTPPMPETRKF